MKTKVGLIALGLRAMTAGVLGYFPLHGWTSQSEDKRTAIHLALAERDLVLGEMRQMLHSVHNLMTGLSANDAKVMEHAARASGLSMAAEVNPMLIAKLPLAFKKQDMSVHRDFDALADNLAKGMDRDKILHDFTGITARCVGCQAAYRLP